MPKPLDRQTERVNWRIFADDLAVLEAAHGRGETNAVVRALIRAYCDRLRARASGGLSTATPGAAAGGLGKG